MRRALSPAGILLGGLLASSVAHAAPPSVSECLDASEQGEAMRDEGKLLRARERFATCASASCPAPVRATCGRWLESVIERIPTVILVVRDDDDVDLTDASVIVDGAATATVSGKPVELDPGAHTLDIEAPGYTPTRHTFVASLGDKNRLVRVRMARATGSDDGHAPEAGAPRRTLPSPARPEEPPSSKVPALAIGLGAVALGTLGASLFVGLDARGDLSELRASPCGATRTCDASAVDDLRVRFVVADVLVGVAVVAAAAAVWTWLAAPSPADQREKHSRFHTRRPLSLTW